MLKLVKIFPISDKIAEIMSRYDNVFFFEESYEYGSISEKYCALCGNLHAYAINGFVPHGERKSLLNKYGLSPQKMAKTVEDFVKK
jgi:1-deoxy-D-xylulose-5-phosphate synthase